MTVRGRLLAIDLMEREARDPRYAARLGVHVYWKSVVYPPNLNLPQNPQILWEEEGQRCGVESSPEAARPAAGTERSGLRPDEGEKRCLNS